jgi:ADP-ribosylglycohydrolase
VLLLCELRVYGTSRCKFEYNLRRAPFASIAAPGFDSPAGAVMPVPPPTLDARARGAFRGAVAGAHAVPGGASGALALARILAEELAGGHTDLQALAFRWVERYRADPGGLDDETAAALEYLDAYRAPPHDAPGRGSGPLARTLPVALAALGSPRNLVSATYHIAALTHPDPRPAWSAVAVNLALAQLIGGARDFIPGVLEALRGNDVPPELTAAIRRVPLERRERLPPVARAGRDAVAATEIALWLAHHEPRVDRALDWLAGDGLDSAGLGCAAGALLGARGGEGAVPPSRLPAPVMLAEWDHLADRLARLTAAV